MVSRIGEHFAHQDFIAWNLLPVLSTPRRSRISAREEGRSTGSADGALAIGLRKGDAVVDQSVDVRCAHERVSQRTDGVVTLLVRA